MIGLDPAGVEDHWDRMYYRLTRWRNGPVMMTALSAVDIALWDLEGKRLGVPTWRLLGAAPGTRLRVYFTHWDTDGEARRLPTVTAKPPRHQGRGLDRRQNRRRARPHRADRIARTVRKSGRFARPPARRSTSAWSSGSLTRPPAIRFAQAMAPYHPLFLEEATLREYPRGHDRAGGQEPRPHRHRRRACSPVPSFAACWT